MNSLPTIRKIRVCRSIAASVILWCAHLQVSAAAAQLPYVEAVPGFNRTKSQVMIRHIAVPTLANLDFAAYDRNPLLCDVPERKPKKNPSPATVEGLTFVGALLRPVDAIAATPLTADEKSRPIAWKPFVKRAWEVVKDDRLQFPAGKISGYKWADPLVFQPYQEVTTLYLHDDNGSVELWVKVEFAPWVAFLSSVNDEDNDGIREIYGMLNTRDMSADSLAKTIAWVRHDYAVRLLTPQEQTDWAVDLASYWYPTRNTDILDLAKSGIWPDLRTGKKILRELGGVTVQWPLAVIEGKPVSPDKPVYNVFVVDRKAGAASGAQVDDASPGSKAAPETPGAVIDIALADNFRNNNRTFTDEVTRYGTYRQWEQRNLPFFDGVRVWLHSFPPGQMGLEGKDHWLFFRKSFDVMLGGDITRQAETANPLPHLVELKNFLAQQGVELLFVPVPNKEEIYYDHLSDSIPGPAIPLVNPYARKFLADLQQAGVEVIDLYGSFLDAKRGDSATGVPVYQPHDTHWTGRGMEIAADRIAGRIRQSAWYTGFRDTVSYTVRDTVIVRQGDLAERLPADRQAAYPPYSLPARRVFNPDKTPYTVNHPAAPVLLIGDSFTGVFELVDCRSAGIGSHIAYRTRVPVDVITSWGGGPVVRQKMLRMREHYLDRKRVVIYLMVVRDLFQSPQVWEPLDRRERAE
jgi:alginate O-acetyltransferase complex protein AlgJ